MKGKEVFSKIGKAAVQLLFPLRCPVCDEIVVPYGEKICLECMKKLKIIQAPRCLCCGKHLEKVEQEYCHDCASRRHYFTAGRSLYEYGSVAGSIYRFKYGRRREYADFFGEEMAACLGDFLKRVAPGAMVPVPLHRKRMRKRGYNQALLLARAIGRYTGIPVYEKLVRRVKNTTPLKQLNPQERQNNLKKAFHIAGNDVKLIQSLQTILVVDDIYTTGSTLDEVAKTLLEAGAKEVYFVTLAGGRGM